jgi:hypothetical protein
MIWMFDPLRSGDSGSVPDPSGCVTPIAPIMLWATDLEMYSFTANWSASATSETKGYRLSISEFIDFSVYAAGYDNIDVGNVLSYPVSGLNRFTNYYMRVTAYDGACESSVSNIVLAQTTGEYVPVAIDASSVLYGSFNANWLAFQEPVIRYFLDVSTNSSFSSFVPGYENLDVGDVLTYPVVGLDDDTIYYYRLRAETTEYLSDDSNTISARTVTIYSACATFGPSFNTPLVSAMFLSADILVLSSGSIGHYAIDWRLDSVSGAIVFTSGNTFNTSDVQAQHPFSDEVVFAGTLYPTIKYIYVDGEKYTSAYEAGARYSPDLMSCLPSVVVSAVDCSSVLGTNSLYPYYITYNNLSDPGLDKSRKIKFNLSSNTAYFAWLLNGFDVPEQIKIYYCTLADTEGVLIDNFIHGRYLPSGSSISVNLYPADYPINPRITNPTNGGFSPALAFISRLDAFTYQVGDYLRIEVIGSVYDPTITNTNWQVGFKCLTAADMDCSVFDYDSDIHKIIDTPVMSYASDPTCQYQVSYNTLDEIPGILPSKSTSVSNLYKYNSGFSYYYGPGGGNPAGNITTNPVKLGLRWYYNTSNYSLYNNTGFTLCQALASGETVTLQKDTSFLSLIYSNQSDYDLAVSNVNEFHLHSSYITWSGLTDSDSRYYALFRMVFREAVSCGDAYTDRYLYFWFGTPITFDYAQKKITFEFIIPVNSFADSICNNVKESVDGYIANMTATKNLVLPGGSVTSNVKMQGLLYSYWPVETLVNDSQREYGYGITIQEVMLNGVCDLSLLGFCYLYNVPNALVLLKYWDRITLTDTTDHASRLANWRHERKIGLRTGLCSDYDIGDWEIIREEP